MLNLKKEAKSLEVAEVKLANCPICKAYVCHKYFMQDAVSKRQSKWYSCSCGIVFQEDVPKGKYDKAYWDKYAEFDLKTKASYEYPVRIYMPLIEELVYGRRALLVGRDNDHQHNALETRGWVAETIDKNDYYVDKLRCFTGDFETYEFNDNVKYSLIWLYSVMECFKEPVEALNKCMNLLTEDGILFIASPDTDFINTRSSSSFIHWKPEHNHIMWNRSSISRHLEKLGFNIIMNRQNYEHRFPAHDDFHIIAQKKFF
jgi:predicted SAM-dependent methyltransferase